MLTLIHGDDNVLSRKALNELKSKYEANEKILFNGSTVTISDLVSVADSLSLFGQDKFIVIENMLSSPMSKEKEKILEFLKNQKSSFQIIIWEQKEIGKTILKKYFANAKQIICQVHPILFKFLESIGEKTASQVLAMFHDLISDHEGELILSMLIRQWRNLIIAGDLGVGGFAGLPSWQANKFVKQAHFFNMKNLLISYRQLLSLDVKVKMSLSPYTLNQLLDIFLVSLYYN